MKINESNNPNMRKQGDQDYTDNLIEFRQMAANLLKQLREFNSIGEEHDSK